MNKGIRAGIGSALLLSALGGWTIPAQAEDLYFTLINRTSVPITEFYVSPSGINRWEQDLLGNRYLDAQSYVQVRIGDGRSVCEYDIGAQFADGEAVTDYGIDLCDLGEYTFYE